MKCCQGFHTDLLPQQYATRQVLRLSSVSLSHTQSQMHHCETEREMTDYSSVQTNPVSINANGEILHLCDLLKYAHISLHRLLA